MSDRNVERKIAMKKIIVCDIGEWTKKLITLSRFEDIEYFVDDKVENKEIKIISCGIEKKVFPLKKLVEENPDEIILIIGDSKLYFQYKEKLELLGFKENVHFFNGWKLTTEFYSKLFKDNTWEKIENSYSNIFGEDKVYEYRAKTIAELIPKEVKSIMDLGCGNGILRKYVKNVQYFGVDYKKRNEETIICNLDQEPLPNIHVDLYCLIGVIYYLKNVKKLVYQMRNAKYVLLTYRGLENYLRLDNRFDGIYAGGIENSIYTADLINMFSDLNFMLINWVRGYPMGNMTCNEDIFIFKKMA